jgi:hypothetical protein
LRGAMRFPGPPRRGLRSASGPQSEGRAQGKNAFGRECVWTRARALLRDGDRISQTQEKHTLGITFWRTRETFLCRGVVPGLVKKRVDPSCQCPPFSKAFEPQLRKFRWTRSSAGILPLPPTIHQDAVVVQSGGSLAARQITPYRWSTESMLLPRARRRPHRAGPAPLCGALHMHRWRCDRWKRPVHRAL